MHGHHVLYIAEIYKVVMRALYSLVLDMQKKKKKLGFLDWNGGCDFSVTLGLIFTRISVKREYINIYSVWDGQNRALLW